MIGLDRVKVSQIPAVDEKPVLFCTEDYHNEADHFRDSGMQTKQLHMIAPKISFIGYQNILVPFSSRPP